MRNVVLVCSEKLKLGKSLRPRAQARVLPFSKISPDEMLVVSVLTGSRKSELAHQIIELTIRKPKILLIKNNCRNTQVFIYDCHKLLGYSLAVC